LNLLHPIERLPLKAMQFAHDLGQSILVFALVMCAFGSRSGYPMSGCTRQPAADKMP